MSKRPSDSGDPPAKEARGEEFLCPLTKRLPIPSPPKMATRTSVLPSPNILTWCRTGFENL